MNQIDFAKAAGVTQATVSLWEKGTHRPNPDAFTRLASLAPETDKFFFLEEAGLPKEFFLGSMEKTMPTEMVLAAEMVVSRAMDPELMRKVDVVMVPLLSDAAAAGDPRSVDERDVEEIIPIPSSWFGKNVKPYGLRLVGDSMSPILQEGFIVVIDASKRDPKKLVNRMIAARVKDGVTIKWLRSDGKHFMLVAQNVSPRHQTLVLTSDEDWAVIGEVIRWIGEPPSPRG